MKSTKYILKQDSTPKFWVGGAMQVTIEKYESKAMLATKPESITPKIKDKMLQNHL